MNVTLNTVNLNNSYKYTKNQNKRQATPSFTSVAELPTKSGFLKPFDVAMDKFTDFIAKQYTKRVYESPVAKWLSRREDASQIVNHMQMLGSVVVSGMYMTQTLRNKNLEDETKKKLSINQAFTWLAATAGAYWLDDYLAQSWDNNVSLKYANKFLKDNNFIQNFKDYNTQLENEFKADIKNADKKFKPATTLKYVEKFIKNSALESDLKGLDVLKSLVIFGTIYRFISPVAVTPIANWVGDKFFAKKPEKDVSFEAKQPEQPQKTETENVVLERPNMAKFAGKFKKSA